MTTILLEQAVFGNHYLLLVLWYHNAAFFMCVNLHDPVFRLEPEKCILIPCILVSVGRRRLISFLSMSLPVSPTGYWKLDIEHFPTD